MKQEETEKFIVDGLPTLGDEAGRRVKDRDASAPHHAAAQVLPIMQHAAIGRRTAAVLTVAFLAMIALPGTWTMRELFGSRDSSMALPDRLRFALHHNATDQWLKRTWGSAYASATGDGVGNVLIAHDRYLFYRPDFMACEGPVISSESARDVNACICDYDQQLRRRGIHLILLPIPAKTAILPSKIMPDYPPDAGPALNPGYRQWIASLRVHGVDIVDLTDDFWKMASSGETPFQPQDSHWTPDASALAAQRLAERTMPYLGAYARTTYSTRSTIVMWQGDLVELMGMLGDVGRWPPAALNLTQVLHNGEPAIAGNDARVLLLGDSYSEINSGPDLTRGGSAGLSQQLMLRLGCDVQLIARLPTASLESRAMLSTRPEAIRSKRVVIWEFTSRELPTQMVQLPNP